MGVGGRERNMWDVRKKYVMVENMKLGSLMKYFSFKVCYNRYSWGAGKQGSECISWFRRLECIS